MKVFELLANMEPPADALPIEAFKFEMGQMTGQLLNDGIISQQDLYESSVAMRGMNSVDEIMSRIWPDHWKGNPKR